MKEYYHIDLKYGRVYLQADNNIVQKAIWSGYNKDTYEYEARFSSEHLEISEKETPLDALKDYDLKKQDDEFPYTEYVFNSFYNERNLTRIENLMSNNEKITSLHINRALAIAESMNDCLIFGPTSDFNRETLNNFGANVPDEYRYDKRGKSYLTYALESIINALNTENCSAEILERVQKIADQRVVNFESNLKLLPSSDNKKLINDLIDTKKTALKKQNLNIPLSFSRSGLGK